MQLDGRIGHEKGEPRALANGHEAAREADSGEARRLAQYGERAGEVAQRKEGGRAQTMGAVPVDIQPLAHRLHYKDGQHREQRDGEDGTLPAQAGCREGQAKAREHAAKGTPPA
ncbi:hypothetical protein ACFQU7_32585 [Pseudoroseomonas wenyumeiae]